LIDISALAVPKYMSGQQVALIAEAAAEEKLAAAVLLWPAVGGGPG
jgi:hypothetical protein